MELLEKDLTNEILNCFYKIYNTLGYGFLEKVYHKAFLIELKARGIKFESEKGVIVLYEKQNVGRYYPDLLIEDKVIVELKAAETLSEADSLQIINYLKASEIEVGLLLNFGKKPTFKRAIFQNKRLKIS